MLFKKSYNKPLINLDRLVILGKYQTSVFYVRTSVCVVLKLLAILFHNRHIFILLLKFPVRNGKFQTAQEPIKLLDFTFQTARENSHIINYFIH